MTTWPAAKTYCEGLDSTLASIVNTGENTWIKDEVEDMYVYPANKNECITFVRCWARVEGRRCTNVMHSFVFAV